MSILKRIFQRIRFLNLTLEKDLSEISKRFPQYISYTEELLKGGATGVKKAKLGLTEIRPVEIVNVVDKFKPNSILELGSGASTILFLELLMSINKGSKFLSIDESEKWRELTLLGINKFLPNRLNDFELRQSNKVETEYGTKYETEFDQIFDLVYIDGPTVALKDGEKLPCLDIQKIIESGFFPNIIMIDGRLDTVDLIKKIASSEYDFHPSAIYHFRKTKNPFPILFTKYKRHSIFIKK